MPTPVSPFDGKTLDWRAGGEAIGVGGNRGQGSTINKRIAKVSGI
jgi:hypothetical protein